MKRLPSVAAEERWVLTEQGLFDLHMATRCDCNPRLAGLLIQCPDCGTVYGSLREWSPGPVRKGADVKWA